MTRSPTLRKATSMRFHVPFPTQFWTSLWINFTEPLNLLEGYTLSSRKNRKRLATRGRIPKTFAPYQLIWERELCLLKAPVCSTLILVIISYLLLPSSSWKVSILWYGRNMTTCNTLNETEGKEMGVLVIHANIPELYGRQTSDKFQKQTKQSMEKCDHESSAILICSRVSP
jgi:hypothetical protein